MRSAGTVTTNEAYASRKRINSAGLSLQPAPLAGRDASAGAASAPRAREYTLRAPSNERAKVPALTLILILHASAHAKVLGSSQTNAGTRRGCSRGPHSTRALQALS